MSRRYTDAEKIAYYKRRALAAEKGNKAPATRSTTRTSSYTPKTRYTGYGAYKKQTYAKPPKPPAKKSIGQSIGQTIGGGIGLGVEQLIRWATGMGDYNVSKNVLLTQDPPVMVNRDNHGGVVIRHREYLGDVITSSVAGAFRVQGFGLNPGNQYTFPFLSQVAANYEQYSLEGVIFEFRSMSADALNSTNTALGQVIMATNYNAGSPLFEQKSEMENYEFGASCKPSCDMMHPIECAPRLTSVTELYVRTGAVPSGQDIRLYDWGLFQIATNGFQGTSVNVGELWVTYQICLLKPKMFTALGNYNDVYQSAGLDNSYTDANPLGTAGAAAIYSNTIGITNLTINTLNFPLNSIKQSYYVLIQWLAQTAVAVVAPTLTLTNCTLGTYQPLEQIPAATTSSAQVSQKFCIQTDGSSRTATVAWSNTGTLPTGTPRSVRIRILQMPNNFVFSQGI